MLNIMVVIIIIIIPESFSFRLCQTGLQSHIAPLNLHTPSHSVCTRGVYLMSEYLMGFAPVLLLEQWKVPEVKVGQG